MDNKIVALILIILGLIVLAVPLLGVIPLGLLAGFVVLFLGLGLIVAGITDMGVSKALGIIELILGIIALILGLGIMFSPGLFVWILGLIVWIAGIFLIIGGIVGIFTKSGGSRWNGVIALIIGLLYVIIGNFVASDPKILGVLIGLWLLITGILMLFVKE